MRQRGSHLHESGKKVTAGVNRLRAVRRSDGFEEIPEDACSMTKGPEKAPAPQRQSICDEKER